MSRYSRAAVLAAACGLGLPALSAHAAVSCSVSVTSISVNYDPALSTDTVTTGSYTVSCTRLASDPNTFRWSLAANNGLQPSGQLNRAALNGMFYSYELYRTPPYINPNRWGTNFGSRITGTLNFGTQLTASQAGAFDVRLTALQPVRPAGTYADIVTVTLRDASTNAMITQSTFNVSVITIPTCTLTSPPGNVNFNYTSFQPGAASAATSFGVTCTTSLPYTMSLDATSGTLLGLAYSLSLSQTAGSGTGTAQTYAINGTMAGGQAGTCATASCSASDVRTLTISY
jgi:spore coat protein U-like protein